MFEPEQKGQSDQKNIKAGFETAVNVKNKLSCFGGMGAGVGVM